MTRLRRAIDSAAAVLAAAGVDSARRDAEELAAHAAGVDRGRLILLTEPTEGFAERYRELVAARAERVPLQHLLGEAAFGPVTLAVGPGVLIPRPETEALLEWATGLRLPAEPLIVDLCTGSGALALALARHLPRARVVGVDDCATALDYARRNCAGTPVLLRQVDVTAPGVLDDLVGAADLVVANPPYIPDGTELPPEVAGHDPAHALFGGPDGMTVVAAVIDLAVRLLTPGGRLGVEHDDTTSGQTVERVTATGRFDRVAAHRDLAGRPRFVTATRKTDD